MIDDFGFEVPDKPPKWTRFAEAMVIVGMVIPASFIWACAAIHYCEMRWRGEL